MAVASIFLDYLYAINRYESLQMQSFLYVYVGCGMYVSMFLCVWENASV